MRMRKKISILVFFLVFLLEISSLAETNSLSNNSILFSNSGIPSKHNITKEKSYPGLLNFIPSAGHFCSGQTGKGISDIWNMFSLFWYLIEQNNAINNYENNLNDDFPDSRFYINGNRNLDILRKQYSIGMYSMIILSYINSVIDSYNSNNNESSFGTFLDAQYMSFNTYVPVKDGYIQNDFMVVRPNVGLTFGYKNVFEYYAKMVLPIPGNILYYNTYVDWILPFESADNLELFLGLGFVVSAYGKEPDVFWGSGLGSHIRVGATCFAGENHAFRLTLAPYTIWNSVNTKDNTIADYSYINDNERYSAEPIGKNYGFSFIYKYKLKKRFFIESYFEFANMTEPEGDYIEYDPDNNDAEIIIHRGEQVSQLIRVNLSLNYQFVK